MRRIDQNSFTIQEYALYETLAAEFAAISWCHQQTLSMKLVALQSWFQ